MEERPEFEQTAKSVRFLDRDMRAAELHGLAGGAVGVFSARCPGVEGPNEDAAVIIPFGESNGVLVVADGLGGGAAGHEASQLAITEMRKAVKAIEGTDNLLRTAIINGFECANEAVKALGVGAGTTLVALEIQRRTVRPYHVGDSMILVVGGRGRIKYQNIPHSPIGYGVESGLIDETDAMFHKDRHIVSNIIGSAEMHIEVGPSIELAQLDSVVLASDGLSDNLHADEIVAAVRKGSLAHAMKALAAQGGERMRDPAEGRPSKPDDLTFVVFRPRARG